MLPSVMDTFMSKFKKNWRKQIIYIYETKMGSKCHTVYVDIVRNVYCFTKSLTGVCVNLFFKYAYCFLGSLLMGF